MDRYEQNASIQSLLNGIIERDILVIVEGEKDKRALQEFGVTRVLRLCALHRLLEKVAHEKEVVVLTDLDKEGKRAYGKIKDVFSRHGIAVNDALRNFLFKKTKLRQIEGLGHYLDCFDELQETFLNTNIPE